MDKPNVAVVGYGFAGRCFHAYLVGLADGLNLYGIVTSRAEARAQIERDLKIKTFAHFEEALNDPQVDLVVLATPNDLHASQAIAAMEAGKDVVSEKPMTRFIAEGRAVADAEKRYGRVYQVGTYGRFGEGNVDRIECDEQAGGQ